MTARVESWLAGRASGVLAQMIQRIAETDDVEHVAIMPDAHVAEDVCVGTVTATNGTLIPAAVGGDIGCGMIALGFDVEVKRLDERYATRIFDGLYARIPCTRHRVKDAPPMALEAPLSTHGLESMKERD
jgi:tRNA-splicing ligase RtcB